MPRIGKLIRLSLVYQGIMLVVIVLPAQENSKIDLKSALHFHVSFDGAADANIAVGDRRIFTAESLARKKAQPGIARKHVSIVRNAGKYGDAFMS